MLQPLLFCLGPQLNTNTDCVVGKFGALVEMDSSASDLDPASLVDISNQLCQHIVGMNPQTVGQLDDCEPSQNKEEDLNQNQHEATPPSGEATPPSGEATPPDGEATPPGGEATPPDGEATPSDSENADTQQSREEERRLMCQEFLLDSTCTVGEILKSSKLEIKDFVRFECGEELPEDEQQWTHESVVSGTITL